MSTGDPTVGVEASDTHPPPDASSKAASASGLGSRSVSPALQTTTAMPSESNENNAQSQPMTASVSSSSLQPPLENGDNAASGYGTRSRNRTGGARPNYAEDKELDLEIEALSKPSRASKRSTAAVSEQQQPVATGFASVNGSSTSEKPAESAPAPVATPAPAPAPSKKRKHPGSNHTVATPSASTSASRTKPATSVPFKGYVETNMMGFSRFASKLNAKKQLVADDGTVIQANGKKSSVHTNKSILR